MAKQAALGWTTLDVDDSTGSAQDLSEDTNSLQFSTPRNVFEVTGVNKSAVERIHGLADFSITLNGTFDDDTSDSVHDVFAVLDNARTVTLVVSAQTLANECLATDYALNRQADGQFTYTVPLVLSDGTVPTWS